MAQALLGTPELLLLDEPTNGLDPAGIHEVRTLVRDLPQRRGMTVFLSSHLLAEVEQVATHFAIISQGELKFEGTPQELRKRSRQLIVVEVDQPQRAVSLLSGLGRNVTSEGNRLLVEPEQGFGPERINALLVAAGIAVSHLSIQGSTLEDAFLEMTSPAETLGEVLSPHEPPASPPRGNVEDEVNHRVQDGSGRATCCRLADSLRRFAIALRRPRREGPGNEWMALMRLNLLIWRP